MKKINIQKKNFKKYISLTLMLSGINAFGMDFPQELQNVAVISEKAFILELEEDLKKIINVCAEIMETPSYIDTGDALKEKFTNYLKYIKSKDPKYKNTDQFIIYNIEAILSQEFRDKITLGEDFQIKANNQTLNCDDIFSMIIVINEIFSEMLSKTNKKLTNKKYLIFSKKMIQVLNDEIRLFEDILKSLENILSKAQVENNDQILKYIDQLTSSIKENNEKIQEIKLIKTALHKEDLEGRIYNLEEQNIELEEKNRKLEEKNRKLEEKNRKLEEKNIKLEKKNIELEKDLEWTQKIKNKHQEEYQEELTELKEENKELKKRYLQRMAETQQIIKAFEEKEKQIIKEFEKKEQAKEIELQEEINNKYKHFIDLEKENEGFRRRYKEQIQKTKEIFEKFEKQKKENEELQTKIEEIEFILEEKNIEFHKELDYLQKENINLQKENIELKKKLEKEFKQQDPKEFFHDLLSK